MKEICLKEYEEYQEDEIVPLYQSVGWMNYVKHPEMLKHAYEHSLYTVGAYEGHDLVGVIRVVGDGYSIIYIQDIIVHPDYQGKGIGSRLIEEVLHRYEGVYQQVLLTDEQSRTMNFYKDMGFTPASEMECAAFMKYGRRLHL